jgi:hypothetical protein
MVKLKTHVYVDGFNLYKRALEATPYKWLDLGHLCNLVLSNYAINKIYYFTARIKPTPHDPNQALRQQIYFRALRVNPLVEIIESTFVADMPNMPVYPWEYESNGEPKKVKVINFKEKGSDVNIATQMLIDAYTNQCEAQFVLTADSDLVRPISHLKSVGKTVGLILPTTKASKKIMAAASPLIHHVRASALAASQYPETLFDSVGEFSKPNRWEKTETPTEVGVSRPATEATGDVVKE